MCRRWWVLRDIKAKQEIQCAGPCGVGKALLGGKIWRGRDVPDRIQEKRAGCGVLSPLQKCVVCYLHDTGSLGGGWAGEWPDMTYILTTSFWLFPKAGAEAGDPFGAWCSNMGGSECSSRHGGEWQDSEHILGRKADKLSWWMWCKGRKEESKKMPGLAWACGWIECLSDVERLLRGSKWTRLCQVVEH